LEALGSSGEIAPANKAYADLEAALAALVPALAKSVEDL
jgi:hypothetical protein